MIDLKVIDLFSGLHGWSEPFIERGHEVFSVDIDEDFHPTLAADILELTAYDFPQRPDIILASPPCEAFSVMSIKHHWGGGLRGYEPKTEHAIRSKELVSHTVGLIAALQPKFFVIENPRGMLRKMKLIPYDRVTVWYCRYGEERAKPTDLWGGFSPSWIPKPECKNGGVDHLRSPRGSRNGTQGNLSRALRAKIPYELALEVCIAAENDLR